MNDSVLTDLRRLPSAAWVLFAGTLINRFGSFVYVFLIVYVTDLGYSVSQAGAVLASYGIGSLASSVSGGWLADRLGRRRAIAISMTSSAAAMLGMSQAVTLAQLVPIAFAAGLSAELYRPAAGALLTDLTEPGERVAAFVGYRLAINLGFALGPATAGFLADRSFTLLFIGDAATSLVYAVIALVWLPTGVTSTSREERRGEATRTLLADRRFVLLWLATLGAGLVYMQSFSTFAVHVTDAGLPKSTYGLLMSLNGGLIVLLEIPIATRTRRRSATAVIAFGTMLSGLGFGLLSVADTVGWMAASVVVWTFAEMIAAPIGSSYVADLAPVHLRGRYSGAYGLAFGVSGILGPGLGAAAYDINPDVTWLACAVLGVAAALTVRASGRAQGPPASLSVATP